MGSQNPYVFIVGCPRSGTTLLRRIVDGHPEIAITHAEAHWILDIYRGRFGLTAQGEVRSELLTALVDHPKFAKLQIERTELEQLLPAEGAMSYSGFVTALFDLYGRRSGKALAGDKTPRYVREIATLHELWPTARFIHLIRDGRDVCLSAINWQRKAAQFARRFPTWTEDPVTTAALWWKWHVLRGRNEGLPLGPSLYYEVRYEALVTEPEPTCSELCAFLGLRYDDAMLRFHEGRVRSKPGLSAKKAWLPVTPGLRNWTTQMAPADIEAFEAAAGELVDELGYSRAVPDPSGQHLHHASTIAARFTRNIPAPGQALPRDW